MKPLFWRLHSINREKFRSRTEEMKICSDGNFFIDAVAIVSDGRRMDSRIVDPEIRREWLRELLEAGGVLVLNVHGCEERSFRSLEIRADARNFVSIAGFSDRRPMRWRNDITEKSSKFNSRVEIGGDEWDKNSAISDVAIAERAVAKIFEPVNLSKEFLMNMR